MAMTEQIFAAVAEQAARAGGRVLQEMRGRAAVRSKGPRDFVTQADTESQRVIRDILLNSFPDHDFLGEEDAPPTSGGFPTDVRSPASPRFRWIVDPLDGTTNYVHDLPGFAVSVGLERGGELVAGAVYDPTSDECYVAAQGEGAYLNGVSIRASNCRTLSEAMVAASLSANIERNSSEIAGFIEVLLACHSQRRLGSAALNLCYLAAGRLDAYWTTSVKAWDVAAGVLMVREAGGIATHVDGSALQLSHPKCACAATTELHNELLATLARAKVG